MNTYISKPTEIQAYQLTNDLIEQAISGGGHGSGLFLFDPLDLNSMYVNTTQGRKVPVSVGEWIVTEPDGNGQYPIADHVFKEKYELKGAAE